MELEQLTDVTLPGYLRDSQLPTVLVFHAPWSKPARTMLNVVREVADSYEHGLRFALIDVEQGAQAVERQGVLSLPTYIVFKGESAMDRFIGSMTKEKLTERLEETLKNLSD